MGHTMKQQAAGSVATPASGKATVFIDTADGQVKAKLPNGSVTAGGSGGAGSAAMSCIARVGFIGANGTVQEQDGDAITDVSRSEAGLYNITLEVEPGTTTWQIIPVIGVRMTDSGIARMATYDVTEIGDESSGEFVLAISVWDAAGVRADGEYMNVAILLGNVVEEAP